MSLGEGLWGRVKVGGGKGTVGGEGSPANPC